MTCSCGQAWSRGLFGWLPAPPAGIAPGTPGGILPPAVWYLAAYAWIVSFVALVLGRYRTAQVIAALAIVPDLVWLLQQAVHRRLPGAVAGAVGLLGPGQSCPGPGHDRVPPRRPACARWPWLLALPAAYLLVYVPMIVLQATGNSAWLPDFSGLYCVLAALACLAHAPRARSRQAAGSGVWSLALTLLAADAGAYRIASLTDYLNDPHLIQVSLVELLILVAAAALVTPDAARAQAATPATPPRPYLGYPG